MPVLSKPDIMALVRTTLGIVSVEFRDFSAVLAGVGWGGGGGRDALEGGGGSPPHPLQGAQPMPSYCPPDGTDVTDSNRPQPVWQPPPTTYLTAPGGRL